MSTEIDDGSPAFPHYHSDILDGEHGLSIRDYFAAAALMGMLSNEDARLITSFAEVANSSYRYADAMLVARKGGAK